MLRDVGSKSPPKSTDHDECEDCRKVLIRMDLYVGYSIVRASNCTTGILN